MLQCLIHSSESVHSILILLNQFILDGSCKRYYKRGTISLYTVCVCLLVSFPQTGEKSASLNMNPDCLDCFLCEKKDLLLSCPVLLAFLSNLILNSYQTAFHTIVHQAVF